MNNVDIRRYEMLVRVRDFGAAQTAMFPPSAIGGQAFAAVTKAVADLSVHAASQYSGRGSAREGTTSKAVAREALRDDLEAITRTARALALDNPGLDDKFRPPRGSGDRAVLNAARAFARDAAPIAGDFIGHGMPEDFLQDLDRSITDLEEAIRNHEAGRDASVAARASIESAMEAGLDAVRRLDAIVPNRFRDDDVTLAVWQRARRVEYPSSRPRPESAAPAPAPAPGAPGSVVPPTVVVPPI